MDLIVLHACNEISLYRLHINRVAHPEILANTQLTYFFIEKYDTINPQRGRDINLCTRALA